MVRVVDRRKVIIKECEIAKVRIMGGTIERE